MRLRHKHQPLSVEQLIRSGLPMGFRQMPSVLAAYAEQQRRSARSLGRLGTVGNISALGGNTTAGISMNWAAIRSSGLPNAFTVTQPNSTATATRQDVVYTFGTGAGQINQIAQTTTTIGTSATLNFNVVTWAFNVIGDASATFTAIKEWWFELLTVAQGASAAASDLTLGDHATNAWAPLLGAAGTYAIKSGGMWHHQDQSTAGLAVTAGDLLKSVNNDSSNIATIRITAFGLK